MTNHAANHQTHAWQRNRQLSQRSKHARTFFTDFGQHLRFADVAVSVISYGARHGHTGTDKQGRQVCFGKCPNRLFARLLHRTL